MRRCMLSPFQREKLGAWWDQGEQARPPSHTCAVPAAAPRVGQGSVAADPTVRGALVLEELFRREVETDLALGGCEAIGAVDDVIADGDTEIAADGAGGGVGGICRARHGSDQGDGAGAFDDAGDDRSGGNEGKQALVETFALVLGIVTLGELA